MSGSIRVADGGCVWWQGGAEEGQGWGGARHRGTVVVVRRPRPSIMTAGQDSRAS